MYRSKQRERQVYNVDRTSHSHKRDEMKRNPKNFRKREEREISLNEISCQKWIRTSSELESEVDGLVMHFA